jgi:hypothetical protein
MSGKGEGRDLSRDRRPVVTRDRGCRCLMRSLDTTIDDRRWPLNEGRRPLQKREDGRCEKGRETEVDAQRGRARLYTSRKRRVGMQGALPETGAPNPMGRRLGWKQEGAPLSPGRRLLTNLREYILILISQIGE